MVTEIECKNIMIEKNTNIKLIAKNPRTDVYSDIETFLNSYEYIIEKIKCSLSIENSVMNFELSRTGSFKASEKNIKTLVPIIKNKLMELRK